ncbi:MAG: hypothetical protein LLG01_07240 [Planctomycetaceae bacterium]|nr:hypothetical protein [Planctomycetaceae bacterium]
MKTLIVYYSRTGLTRKAAQDIQQALSADIEEIADSVNHSGASGWILAGRDAATKRLTPIGPFQHKTDEYDLVVIATPVWAFTMASPVRTWLTEHGRECKKVAFLATMGGSGDKRSFEHMSALCGQPPIATLSLIDKDIRKDLHAEKITAFVKTLQDSAV